MAYFYKHIKGLTSRATSFKIDFEQIDDPTAGNMITPTIIKESNQSTTDFGNIITTNASNGRLNNDFHILSTLIFNVNSNNTIGAYKGEIGHNNNGIYLKGGTDSSKATLSINNTQLFFEGVSGTKILLTTPTVDYSQSYFQNNPICFALTNNTNYYGFSIAAFSDSGGTYSPSADISYTKGLFNIPLYIQNYAVIRKSSSGANNGYLFVQNYIHSDSYIEATYFNATSDRRAKTDIGKSNFSALDIIKSLPVYNFKYKSDNTDSIGLIAQEALKVNAGTFSLVANQQASGENGDYMSVKESKLVYIAWKAIQEQQAIIDNQQEQINQLISLVNKLTQK